MRVEHRGATVRVEAGAKLTLSLRVLGRRGDGYHDLDALTVPLREPYDTVELTARPSWRGVTLTVDGPAAVGVPDGPANLAARAAAALAADVAIALHKRIPAGAGLGGGSADAAAVLAGARALLGLEIDDAALAAAGAALGSDVPFCLAGRAAWMRGRGERIVPVDVPPFPVLVAVPPFGIATPEVYAAWDGLGGPAATRRVPPPVPFGRELGDAAAGLANDLEPAAEHVEPRLRPFRERLEAAAGRPALLAGSGSSCVVPFADRERGERAAARARAALPGVRIFLTG